MKEPDALRALATRIDQDVTEAQSLLEPAPLGYDEAAEIVVALRGAADEIARLNPVRAPYDARDLTQRPGEPDAYQILVTRGKEAPWVAEIICDVEGEVNITQGTGQCVLWAIESAWVTWRASRPEEGVVAPPEADVPLPFGD